MLGLMNHALDVWQASTKHRTTSSQPAAATALPAPSLLPPIRAVVLAAAVCIRHATTPERMQSAVIVLLALPLFLPVQSVLDALLAATRAATLALPAVRVSLAPLAALGSMHAMQMPLVANRAHLDSSRTIRPAAYGGSANAAAQASPTHRPQRHAVHVQQASTNRATAR